MSPVHAFLSRFMNARAPVESAPLARLVERALLAVTTNRRSRREGEYQVGDAFEPDLVRSGVVGGSEDAQLNRAVAVRSSTGYS